MKRITPLIFVLFCTLTFAGLALAADAGAATPELPKTGDPTLDLILTLIKTSPALAIAISILYVLKLAAPFLREIFKTKGGDDDAKK